MNIDIIRNKFSSEFLSAVEAEARSVAETSFSAYDLAENIHLIEPFYIQPLFYSMLLNYYTMSQQHSTLSLLEIASDADASDQDKNAIAESFASELGLDLSGQTVESKLLIVHSAISTADIRIKKLQSAVKNSYSKGVLVVSGASQEMFRNSPEHKLFSSSRFSIPFLYENMHAIVSTSAILNQPISIPDAERYNKMIHSGRSGNSADIFLGPEIEMSQHTLIVGDGDIGRLDLPPRKYSYLTVESIYGEENLSFEFSSDINIGFEDRAITIHSSGKCSSTVKAHYTVDSQETETALKSQFPTLDLTFSGMVPIYVDIVLQNESGLVPFMERLREVKNTKQWMSVFRSESSKLSRFGNRSIEMTGDMMVNPIVSRPIGFFNGNIAISGNSIMSWVTEANSFIIPRKITVAETANVTSF